MPVKDDYLVHSKLKFKISYTSFLIIITLVCNFLILFGNSIRQPTFTSFGTRVLIITVFIYGVLLFATNFKSKIRVMQFFVAFFIGTIIVSFITMGLTFISAYLVFMRFLMLPIYFVYAIRFYDEIGKYKRFVYVFNVLYTLLYIYLYFSRFAYLFDSGYGDVIIDELTLGFNNPNETAMYLLISFFVSFSAVFYFKNKFIRVLYSVFALITAYFIYLTASRMAFVLIILAIIVKFTKVLRFSMGKEQIYVLLFPILYAILLIIFPSFFKSINFLGSSFTTDRELIYQGTILNMNLYDVVFGNFAVYGGSNLHNSYLSVFAATGIINFGIYLQFVFEVIKSFSEKIDDLFISADYISLLCLVLYGSVEAALWVSGTVYAGMFFMVIILLGRDNHEKIK